MPRHAQPQKAMNSTQLTLQQRAAHVRLSEEELVQDGAQLVAESPQEGVEGLHADLAGLELLAHLSRRCRAYVTKSVLLLPVSSID